MTLGKFVCENQKNLKKKYTNFGIKKKPFWGVGFGKKIVRFFFI